MLGFINRGGTHRTVCESGEAALVSLPRIRY